MKPTLIFFMIHTKRKKEKREFIMTMKELAWLMPLLFILHDMEEIVLGMAWKKKEPELKKIHKGKARSFRHLQRYRRHVIRDL